MERSDYRFSRRDVREATCWGDTQLKIHLHRLEELEYLLVHRGGRGQSFVYELAFARQPDNGRPMLSGLIDIDLLRKHGYEEKKSGAAGQLSGASRPQVGGVSGVVKTISAPMPTRVPEGTELEIEESTYTDAQRNGHYVLTIQGRVKEWPALSHHANRKRSQRSRWRS
jgi:hypothetical protein